MPKQGGKKKNKKVMTPAIKSGSDSDEIDECFGEEGKCRCSVGLQNEEIVPEQSEKLGMTKVTPPPPKIRSTSVNNTKSTPPNQVPHNTYSQSASIFLSTLGETRGADVILEHAHNDATPKAKKLQVTQDEKFGLVLSESVSQNTLLMELHGYVSMPSEVTIQLSRSNGIFMYNGLVADQPDLKKMICIDTNIHGNDTKFIRRSCSPNSVLKHVLGSHARLGIFVVAQKDIPRNREITVAFDSDWMESDEPLDCVDHEEQMGRCEMERERTKAMEKTQRK